jgi:diacylglycerol kinase (ATP)
MTIILYNPKSRLGNNKKLLSKIENMIRKQGHAVVLKNVLTIGDADGFLEQFKPTDRFVIVGGDGTLHQLVNSINIHQVSQDVAMVQAGTGNDFLRSIKSKDKIISVKQSLLDLPHVVFHEKKQYFINGVGIGLDGYVGHIVDESRLKKSKLGFFKATLKGLSSYQPMAMTLQMQDQTIEIKKTWFVAVMHSVYFGGGMKIAPNASRSSKTLEVVVVKDCPKWLLFIIFPTIYLGWHKLFKSYVQFYQTNEINIVTSKKTYAQFDGEVTSLMNHIHIKR